ncbi:MAG: tetratricopeptide repeat protein, partial [Pseudomonadota bacterium]|nr:tetratricopeptide repeat protein [Pseudomonadota bacterium]
MSEPPGKLEHILLQAISLYHAGRTRETGELCRNILESAPDEPNTLHLLDVVHLMNGDYASAAEYLTSAARVDSGNADILNTLATALRKLGDAEQAEQFYQRGIALDGDSAKSLVNLANLYRGAGNLKHAADHYREALEKDPDYYRAPNNLGLTLDGLGAQHVSARHGSQTGKFRTARQRGPAFGQARRMAGQPENSTSWCNRIRRTGVIRPD